jgi:hypothetical protein
MHSWLQAERQCSFHVWQMGRAAFAKSTPPIDATSLWRFGRGWHVFLIVASSLACTYCTYGIAGIVFMRK